MQPRKFLIADTHFAHANIIKFEPNARPFSSTEEHDEELVKRWNSVVGDDDVVYHLGDFCMNKRGLPYVSRLKGKKYLILGNHDNLSRTNDIPSAKQLLDAGFENVYGCYTTKNAVFTHIPVHPQQLEYRFKYNVHGHLHSHALDDPRYFNVSCEHINLTPILMDKVINELDRRNN